MTNDRYRRFVNDEKVDGVEYAFYRDLLRGGYDAEIAAGGRPMSSFSHPHCMYLFDMRNGKKKLAYHGQSPEDALQILRLRLTDREMAETMEDRFTKVSQRRLLDYVDLLG